MVKLKIEDVIFWLIILYIIGIAIWMLHESPMDSSAIISIGLALGSSELFLWRSLYNNNKNNLLRLSEMDKKTAMSFLKLRNEMEKNNIMINNRFDNLENKLNLIIRKK
ncbi:hypothetical protein J4218_03545 [Candidatus Pacearchaeota archaeon]|nr:hypothetical protein [Candidatus Pacearchaeota archaeon]